MVWVIAFIGYVLIPLVILWAFIKVCDAVLGTEEEE